MLVDGGGDVGAGGVDHVDAAGHIGAEVDAAAALAVDDQDGALFAGFGDDGFEGFFAVGALLQEPFGVDSGVGDALFGELGG